GLGRTAEYNGTIYFDDLAVSPPGSAEADATPSGKEAPSRDTKIPAVPRPSFPRHYPHIRIALHAWNGNPIGPFEDRLIKESVGLVIPHVTYLKHVKDLSPKTPRFIYTNATNLSLPLLTDWPNYADSHNCSREAAFYHASKPQRFTGSSPSSQPVTWFWAVYRGGRNLTDLTR